MSELEQVAAPEEPHALDADVGLFDIEAPPPVTLADRFLVAPLSVLNRRGGEWQERRRRWLSIGIQSELGRDDVLLFDVAKYAGHSDAALAMSSIGGTSIFDPVLCELAYRWHTNPGDVVLDPFSGGSVRGITAATLERWYVGVDLRAEQVEANRSQVGLCRGEAVPEWIVGDSVLLGEHLDPADQFDMVFSCPPYADLEVYSSDPRDLSTMPYDQFSELHESVIRQACERLRENRFAVWVISDVRDKEGAYRGLVADTIRAFQRAGMRYHNDAIIVDPVGTLPQRVGRWFQGTRKLGRSHQHMLIFVKGSAKAATARLEDIEVAGW